MTGPYFWETRSTRNISMTYYNWYFSPYTDNTFNLTRIALDIDIGNFQTDIQSGSNQHPGRKLFQMQILLQKTQISTAHCNLIG
jgi:hypothetical protein